MTAKKRPMRKPKTAIRNYSALRPAIGNAELARLHAEVVRLRQAVHQAELLAAVSKSGSSAPRNN